ncbi:hypothetical protein AK812_SmicGene41791 [Symbiodinium microadriaticum]|uniref:Uncharacterized protein n=1 Tax=Symbiodinium microadriaticum TaxID=2951 RepID=A0A1Q9C591_SYMMI|nr:hypothetical protein AK812_SmicGene41791 [Symbiodinium microadriaticum]
MSIHSQYQHSKSTILDVDMRFIQDAPRQPDVDFTIRRSHPFWIRQRTLEGGLRSGGGGRIEVERQLYQVRTTPSGDVPPDGVELSDRVGRDEDFVRRLFAGQFWVYEGGVALRYPESFRLGGFTTLGFWV